MEEPIESLPSFERNGTDLQGRTSGTNEQEEDDGSTVKLERTLGIFDGVMVNVGIMIGTGIFISPKGVVAGVESVGATICVWVGAGIISLLGALCYAELGTTISSSGGTYTYIRHIFGDFVGFLNFWADTVIVTPSSNAVMALLFSIYCLEPFYPDPDCPPPKIAISLFAILSILLTMFVNCWSVKLTTLFQNVLSICKLIPLGILIVSGLVRLGMGHTEHFKDSFASTDITGLGTALYSCFFSYAGWNALNVINEELKNPSRNLPIAVATSILIVGFVNTLTNVAYFTALSPTELLSSNAVAFSYAYQVLGRFAVIIPITVVLSTFGCLNGSILSSSREFFAGARTGHLPTFISYISINRKTPTLCIITTSTITLCFCFVDNLFTLINFFGFIKWSSFGLAVAGMVVLRCKDPNRPRPFKVNIIIPIIFVLVCVFLAVFGFIGAPIDSLIATAIIVSGIPVYLILVKLDPKIKWMIQVKRKTSVFLQKILLVTSEEHKE
ncbi:Y+L amino acid transporter 2-like [Lytechinus variegatus]|uniref:Y+L amino acid transporter 2-like n=1 Tax=Lytechinus variegatus TaxID=7654 RepID=UPI001BB26E6D|nr:Y+L amino acid transporter 2-like [Lytechinus variegatus]